MNLFSQYLLAPKKIRNINKIVKTTKSIVLDIGCGDGRLCQIKRDKSNMELVTLRNVKTC